MDNKLQNAISALSELLKDIDFKIVLNEVGAGTPVYNLMVETQGLASRKVVHVESNNDTIFNKEYNSLDGNERLVSDKSVIAISKSTRNRVKKHYKDFVSLTNSVQISTNDNCISHGWFCFENDDVCNTYHYTLPNRLTRAEQIQVIGYIGLDILYYELSGILPNNGLIDNTSLGLDKLISFKLNTEPDTLQFSSIVNYNTAFLVENGEIRRLDDFLRTLDNNLIVYKGSFNPVSRGHLNTLNHVIEKTGTKPENVLFCLTLGHRLDKIVTTESIVNRIDLLNKLGYKVIVDTLPYFNHLYDRLRTKSIALNKDVKLHLPLGKDVFDKLTLDIADYFSTENIKIDIKQPGFDNLFSFMFSNCIFHAFNREENIEQIKLSKVVYHTDYDNDDISSTQIRNALKDENYTLLKSLYNNISDNDQLVILNHLKQNKNKY